MRLRSHQFVFLLLLAYCAQLGEDCGLRLLQSGVCGSTAACLASLEAGQPASNTAAGFTRPRALPAAALKLDPASAALNRTAWQLRGPARDSSAVSRFTGFLRA